MLIKAMNFITVLLKIWLNDNDIKSIQHVIKENLLSLKDLLELWKTRFLSIWLLCQKNVYFDVLDDIDDEYNNIYHRTIKMKPIDVKSDSYAECNVNSREKDARFKIDNHIRVSFLLKYMLLTGPKKFLSSAK